MFKSHFEMMAAYNAFANTRLYEQAAKLSDADYRADCGAFFKSVHGTLNHLLVADRIWMKRFTGEGEPPNRLDAILHDDLASLRAARQAEDRRIADYAAGLDDSALKRKIAYQAVTSPIAVEQELWSALTHFFNHQTHHRGQVHALLTRLTGEGPVLDLLAYQRSEAAKTPP
ncbi:DinB family protein [Methylocella silvestris BL2]|uniref:DinB family protein n=1 Tax=Methylocella silvestris (strain DSM 15510 / CIP 108128 / LMG 27833 / NCIMB 13906 / BL2) TaxID=395965 RepID=B8ER34_METSB|nr:DinB family protein [Methylocella silvestris]ACK49779.1 DinB family protein [Methylocella silvestris BL2]